MVAGEGRGVKPGDGHGRATAYRRIGRIKRGSEQWLLRVYPPNPCYLRSIFTDDQEYAVALTATVKDPTGRRNDVPA